jgi:hypothetical protein
MGRKGFGMTRSGLSGVRLKFEENAALTMVIMQKMYGDPVLRGYIDEFIKSVTKTP